MPFVVPYICPIYLQRNRLPKSSLLFAQKARPSPLNCKNEYMVLPLGEETAVQTVVGSIVRAFRRLKKPRCREMTTRGYALHSICSKVSFLFSCLFYPF